MPHIDGRPSKREMLKFQAEDLVRQAVVTSPQFKREVNRVATQLSKIQPKIKIGKSRK